MKSFMLLMSILVLTSFAFPQTIVGDTSQKEADIQAIKKIDELWDAANIAGDAEAFKSLVTDDFIRLIGGIVKGKEGLSEAQKSLFDKVSIAESKIILEEIWLTDDWACVSGSYRNTYVPKDGGDPIKRTGYFMDIRERQSDGTWKIARAIDN